MGCQTQNPGTVGVMEGEVADRPRLTPKGERTRARIVEAAARLIYERGVAGTTLDDVKAAAEVSGSQMYHYFPDKDELVQAVITYQADVIAGNQRRADLGSAEGLQAWRDMVIAQARSEKGKGGCPLGSLAGQLAETDPRARALLASGFGQWQAAIGDGLRRLHQAGDLPDGTDPDALAVTLLATLQGGLLLAQAQRDTRPLETAVDTLLKLARGGQPLLAAIRLPADCRSSVLGWSASLACQIAVKVPSHLKSKITSSCITRFTVKFPHCERIARWNVADLT
jgi:TetR/AcrR family transcriptional regulator, transcriptional repressor for nem operon